MYLLRNSSSSSSVKRNWPPLGEALIRRHFAMHADCPATATATASLVVPDPASGHLAQKDLPCMAPAGRASTFQNQNQNQKAAAGQGQQERRERRVV